MIKNFTRLFENDFQNIEEIINVKCEKYCDDIPLVIKKNNQSNSFSYKLHQRKFDRSIIYKFSGSFGLGMQLSVSSY